jgi:CheY-like chemotaxis protein
MVTIAGKRVLIVEDDGLAGEAIADMISDAGGWPLGPVLSEREALDMINYNPGTPDVAILDAHLGAAAFRVARRLAELGVPVIFASGHARDIPDGFHHAPLCETPCTTDRLLSVLTMALEGAPARRAA